MFASELWVIYALVFGAVLLAVQGAYVFLFKARSDTKAVNRRLALTAELNSPSEVLEVLRRERGLDFLAGMPGLANFNTLLIQSGVRMTGTALVLLISTMAIAFFLIFSTALGSGLLALPLAMVAALVSIYAYLRLMRARRIAKFSEQFPEALDVVVRGLRAGHPFRVALALVARELPDPAGSEFGIVADEVMFGLDQSAAIENLTRRVGQGDLAFFATAVNIQQQTGGNLAEILTRLSRLLRQRSKLRLKIRALSSEGRLSAIALSLAPFVLMGIITLISPDYFGSVRDHPVMHLAAGVGLLLLAIGNFVMYRMVNFKF